MAAEEPAAPAPILHISDGGLAAEMDGSPFTRVFVGPATADQRNTVRAPLRAIACWRVEEARFAFDSSFVLPAMAEELALLAEMRERLARVELDSGRVFFPSLAVFGHSDPTGADEYNKGLAGRRAQAVYGLLARRDDLWEELFHTGGWGAEGLAAMQRVTGPATGLTAPAGRRALYLRYMEQICVRRDGTAFSVPAAEFLGGGLDGRGKADFQGCSEFNPVLMFSKTEQQIFARPEHHDLRDVENEPNRRVLVLLFRPGLHVPPDAWPCPRASEGSAGCRKRFFADADRRRANGAKRRTQQDDRDTFACRFYDRLAGGSPCEVALPIFRVRLYDGKGKVMPRARFRLSLDGRPPREGIATDTGFVTVRGIPQPVAGIIEWGPGAASDGTPALQFANQVLFDPHPDPDTDVNRKLAHLGYLDRDARENVRTFQRDHARSRGLSPTGLLDGRTRAAINEVHDSAPIDIRPEETPDG
jgi:hypothetical protein